MKEWSIKEKNRCKQQTFDGVLDKLEKVLEVALHVEEHDGLGVNAELRPCSDLEELFHGSITTRHRDESVALSKVKRDVSFSSQP